MMETVEIRRANRQDLDAVYAICLKTGAGGLDATSLYRDPKLVGHIYAAPYVALNGFVSFVAEDADGVMGYVVGAVDTRDFERRLERDWWPDLRKLYSDPGANRSDLSPDELRARSIHQPRLVPEDIVAAYPAHIHMNLLERARGKGVGSGLLDAWMEAARAEQVSSVHAGVSGANHSGLKFWMARGFKPLREDSENGPNGTIWCGRRL